MLVKPSLASINHSLLSSVSGILRTLSALIFVLLLSACTGSLLMHRNSCPAGKIQSGSLCVDENTTKAAISNCVDFDMAKVLAGQKVTLCDGSTRLGTLVLSNCTKDGQMDCIAVSGFKALNVSKLSPDKIAYGTTIAGVVGSKRDMKQCRNAAQLSLYDSSYPVSNLGANAAAWTFTTANVNTGTDVIDLTNIHGLKADFQVKFSSTTTLPAPLTAGTTYYVIVNSTTTIKLAATAAGTAIDITSIGAGTHTIDIVPDGVASYWDTTDDYNNGLTAYPANNPWSSSDYICDSSNFTNVSGGAGLVPSNSIPTGATIAFTQIWQDNLTGMYVSNPLYAGAANTKTWADAILMCESLNGGTAGNGWRLPVQKEILQLYVDGISKVPVSGMSLNNCFWAATTPAGLNTAYCHFLSNAQTFNNTRSGTGTSAFCVR